jgi:hypothetical protein
MMRYGPRLMTDVPPGAADTRNVPLWNERRAQTFRPTAATWAAMTNGDEAKRLPVAASARIAATTNTSGTAEVIIVGAILFGLFVV